MYAAQIGVAPPSFVFFTNVATTFHFSYERFLVNQLPGCAINKQIDPSNVNAEVIRLGEEDPIRQTMRDILMGVTGDENGGFWKLCGNRHAAVGKIIAPGPLFQTHVPSQDNDIGTARFGSSNGTAHRLDWIFNSIPSRFRRKPKGIPASLGRLLV
jgi:hypothetical protein